MKTKNKVLYISVGMLFVACNSGRLSPAEYQQYIEDAQHGFVQACTIGHAETKIVHVDPDYLAVQYFRTNSIPYDKFMEARNAFEGLEYFSITMTDLEGNDLADMNTFYDYQFQDHLRLIHNGDTTQSTYYLPEPFDGIKREKRILAGFPKPAQSPSKVHLWIRPIVNRFTGAEIRFDLNRQRPEIDL